MRGPAHSTDLEPPLLLDQTVDALLQSVLPLLCCRQLRLKWMAPQLLLQVRQLGLRQRQHGNRTSPTQESVGMHASDLGPKLHNNGQQIRI